ncbi:MAG TPA: GNAT family N-acetyltransferase [Acetobacteraceae bacterium]|nr:GNAT family N-acetyltransferase [Acetobacteraceae bacterium]
MIRFEVVRDATRFQEIEAAWLDLWRRSGAGIFQHHGWIAAWWHSCTGNVYRLRIGLAWQDQELVAVLPLAIRSWRGLRLLEWAAQSFSDYCDIIGSPAVLEELWGAVAAAGGFDMVRLKNIAPEARVLTALRQLGLREAAERHPHDLCLRVTSQWANGEAWFRSLNKKKRNNHTRGARILAEFGDVAHRQYTPGEPLQPVLDRLMALKRDWLRANRLTSPLLDNNVDVLPRLVQALSKIGSLRIFTIECSGEVVAGSVNVVQKDKMMAFFSAYDPKYDRASPGISLMTEYTRWAFDQGIAVVDYLRGGEPYKFEFANAAVELTSVVEGWTFRGKALLAGVAALAAARRTLARLRSGATGPAAVPAYGGAYLTQSGMSRIR